MSPHPDASFDRRVEEFESLWRRGGRPDLAAFLPPEGAARLPVLVELAHADLEFRLKAGEPARAEDYLGRFPELAADPAAAAGLITAEFRLRREREPGVTAAEFAARFPRFLPGLLDRLAVFDTASAQPGAAPSTRTNRAAVAAPATPARVGGYELLAEVGRGGMGVVYKARDTARGGVVALKTLPWADAASLYRFKQEFRSLAGVTHPNLVALYELLADGSTWCFTMELVEGENFLRHVRAGRAPGGYDPDRLRAATAQLADALGAVHAAGRLHRDLKPSNVLVDRAGRVVVLDFGLAAQLDAGGEHQSTQRGVVGTVAYMSPEQAAGLPVGPPTDWYSLGVMLFEAVTGRLPFEGSSVRILSAKQDCDPPEPREVCPQVPEDLNALCAGLLRRDPGKRLGAEAVRAWAGAPARAAVAPEAPAPLGRAEHLRALAAAYEAVRAGRPAVARVHGRSGAGKSLLLTHFLAGLAATGEAVVLAGRCYEQESVPYKAFDQVIDGLSRYLRRLPDAEADALLPRDAASLARVFPVLAQVGAVARAAAHRPGARDQHELRRRAFAALRELLARLGDRRPLVVAIDDGQWGDPDSAALLAELLRPPDPPVLLLVVAYRSEDAGVGPCLRALGEIPGAAVTDVPVGPLAEEDARALAATLLGPDGDPALAPAVAAEAGGSPFFIHELVQHVRAGRRPGSGGSGPALADVLWDRIAVLPPTARRLLEVLTVATGPLRELDLIRAAGADDSPHAALAALRAGRYARAVAGSPDRVEPYHDRIREAVAARLAPEARAELHNRLALTLEAAGDADPEALAVHFAGAGRAAEAGRYFTAAALRASEALAFDRSARLYRQALDLLPPGAAGERDLRVKLADALVNAGRGREAAEEYLTAAAGADPGTALDLKRSAADQLLRSGYVDRGLAVMGEVLAAAGVRVPRTPLRALVGLLARRAVLRVRGLGFRPRPPEAIPPDVRRRLDACDLASRDLAITDTILGAYFHARHLQLALRAGDPRHAAVALLYEAGHLSSTGTTSPRRVGRVLALGEAAARLAGGAYLEGLRFLIRGIIPGLAGGWKACHDLVGRAEEVFRSSCTGVTWELDTVHRFSLWTEIYRGEIASVRQRLPAIIREAAERGNLYGETNLSTFVGPLLRLAEGDPGRARRELEESMARWPQAGFHVQHLTRLMDEAQIDLYSGDPAAAHARIAAGWPALARSLLLRIQQLRVFMYDVRARAGLAVAASRSAAGAAPPEPPARPAAPAWATDQRSLLRRVDADCRRLERERMPWPTALAVMLRAGAAAVRGEVEQAAALLKDAAGRFDALVMPMHAATARRRLGQLLGGDEGRAITEAADADQRRRGIADPVRLADVFAPGYQA